MGFWPAAGEMVMVCMLGGDGDFSIAAALASSAADCNKAQVNEATGITSTRQRDLQLRWSS